MRWSSLYAVIDSFIVLKPGIIAFQVDQRDENLMIQGSEWSILSDVLTLLKPIAEATTAIQSRFEAPASVIIPIARVLQSLFATASSQTESFVQKAQ